MLRDFLPFCFGRIYACFRHKFTKFWWKQGTRCVSNVNIFLINSKHVFVSPRKMCGVFAEISVLTHRMEMQFASSLTEMPNQFFVLNISVEKQRILQLLQQIMLCHKN